MKISKRTRRLILLGIKWDLANEGYYRKLKAVQYYRSHSLTSLFNTHKGYNVIFRLESHPLREVIKHRLYGVYHD